MTDNSKAAATKGDSAVGYLVLCSAWAAAKKASTAKLPALPTTTAFDEIQQFNISLVTEEWKLLIDGTPDKKGWDAIKATVKQKASEVDWSKEWPGWKAARKATADQAEQWRKNNPRGLTDSYIPELRGLINATATAAAALSAELKRPTTTGSKPIEQKIQELGKQAICGASGNNVYTGVFCKDTTGTSDNTKSVTCAKANNGKSIGLDIVCMCTGKGANHCASGASGYAAGQGSIQGGAIKAFTDQCTKAAEKSDLPTTINEAVTAARAAITWDNGGGAGDLRIIGKAAGNSCEAASDWCIDYSDYYEKGKGFDQIPWVKHLLEIAKLYKEYTKHLAEKAVIKSQLEALRDRVRIEYTRARPEKKLLPTQAQGKTTPTAESSSKENVCDKHHARKDNCTKAQCNYDANVSDVIKCRSKEGSETPATETGDGAAGVATTDK
uniref:Variant surface glycoprotein 1291 n=1 Tax=Trypanosoma brucei TaxID=5691 RepID=M4TBB4_9TRYP|nr:variant surface glycoprotein 1291 [Trypanosoma brucei]